MRSSATSVRRSISASGRRKASSIRRSRSGSRADISSWRGSRASVTIARVRCSCRLLSCRRSGSRSSASCRRPSARSSCRTSGAASREKAAPCSPGTPTAVPDEDDPGRAKPPLADSAHYAALERFAADYRLYVENYFRYGRLSTAGTTDVNELADLGNYVTGRSGMQRLNVPEEPYGHARSEERRGGKEGRTRGGWAEL